MIHRNAKPTRFKELGYIKWGKDWRLVDNSTGSTVGPIYSTLAELMGELSRYAEFFGCETRRPGDGKQG